MRSKMRSRFSRAPPTRPATRPLEHVHFDFVPALPVRGMGGYVGFALLVDEFTDMWFGSPIRSKGEIVPILEHFRVTAERHFRATLGEVRWPHTLSGLRSDGEACNVSKAMQDWCAAHHISHELSAPYCQWQNGRVERAIQTVWQGAEAMRRDGSRSAVDVGARNAFVHPRA